MTFRNKLRNALSDIQIDHFNNPYSFDQYSIKPIEK